MADLVEGVDAPALASGRHPFGQPTRPSQKMWVIVRATARDRPYYITSRRGQFVYSRGDPSRSPWCFLLPQNGLRSTPEFLRDLLQASRSEITVSAHIALGQFPPDSRIGTPVLATTLLAFFAHSVGAVLAMEGERGDLARPDQPGL